MPAGRCAPVPIPNRPAPRQPQCGWPCPAPYAVCLPVPLGTKNTPEISDKKSLYNHHNGSRIWAANHISGDNPATNNSVVFAVISAGPDRAFQTSCSQAATGAAQGDDVVQVYTLAKFWQGAPGTWYQGAAVKNASALSALSTGSLPAGHLRLQTDTATLSAWNGSTWSTVSNAPANPAAGHRNIVINGNFDIWQRGTGSFTITPGNGSFTADHWMLSNGSGSVGNAIGQQVSLNGVVDAPPGARYAIQITPQSSNNGLTLTQPIEDVHTWAGQYVTISWWAKLASTGSASILPEFLQDFGPGGTSGSQANGTSVNLTTSWTRYWQTIQLPALPSNPTIIADQHYIQLGFWIVPATGSVQIAQVQLELASGPNAPPSAFATRSLSLELAMCQRYYETNVINIEGGYVSNESADTLKAYYPANASASFPVTFRVRKRIVPDGSIYGRNTISMDTTGGSSGFTSFTDAVCASSVNACAEQVTRTGFADVRKVNSSGGVITRTLGWNADADYYN